MLPAADTGDPPPVAIGQRLAEPPGDKEEGDGHSAQHQLAPPRLVQFHMIAGPPRVPDDEQDSCSGVQRQMRSIAMLNGRVRLGTARKSRTPNTAAMSAPIKPMPMSQNAPSTRYGRPSARVQVEIEDQRRHKRPDRHRDDERMKRVTCGTSGNKYLIPQCVTTDGFSAMPTAGSLAILRRDHRRADFGVSLWSAGDQRDSVWRGRRNRP